MTVLDGFVPYRRPSPYLDLIGPLYEAAGDASHVLLHIDKRHTNARGWVHAGVLVAVADTVMGHTAQREGPEATALVTVSLTTDFPGTAHVDDWVEGLAAVRRVGRRLAFATCQFTANDRLVLAATGVFAVVQRRERDAQE